MDNEHCRLLIIDDEQDFADTLATRLELRGFSVACAFSGEAGLALLRTSPPDILLLDMRMPGLSGVDLLRLLRGGQVSPELAGLPVYIISGHASEVDITKAEDLGIQGYYTKPLQLDALLEDIAALRKQRG